MRSSQVQSLYGPVFLLLIVLGGATQLCKGDVWVEQVNVTSAPIFEVDPFWPKPLPNHWVIGDNRRIDGRRITFGSFTGLVR